MCDRADTWTLHIAPHAMIFSIAPPWCMQLSTERKHASRFSNLK